MDSLRALALDLELPERTLRRAAGQGLIRGERLGERKFRTTLREREYLRQHWPLLRRLRGLLRTEQNVRLAVLYGSYSDGSAGPGSDLDLVVQLRTDDVTRVADLSGRLSQALGIDVQITRVRDARQRAALFLDVLDQGRVLIDRDDQWRSLIRQRAKAKRRTAEEPDMTDVLAAAQQLGNPVP